MKKIKIIHDGKTIEAPAIYADMLQAAHDNTERNDQIETAKLTVEIDGETVELILPKDVVANLLSGLGAGAGEEAAAAEEEAAAAAAAGDAGEEEAAVAAAAVEEEEDAARAARGPTAPGRFDAASAKKLVDAAVAKALPKAVADGVKAKLGELRRDEAERAELERIAAPLLSEGYEFKKVDSWKLCADALRIVDGDTVKDNPEAVALAAKARKHDARAQGELIANMKHAAKAKRDGLDDSENLVSAIHDAVDPKHSESDTGVSRADSARNHQSDRFRRPAKASA